MVLGSLAAVVGLCAGGSANNADAEGWVVAAGYEALRLLLVAGLIAVHRRENMARP